MLHLIAVLFVGLVAGWLSGQIMKGRGFGLVGNLLVGIVGAAIGNFLFDAIGFRAEGLIAHLITATIGALVLLFTLKIIRENRV